MKLSLVTLALVAGVLGAPAAEPDLEARQLFGGSTSNDFTRGGCKGVVVAYARGSTESGNVGSLGSSLKSNLNRAFNNDVALQGVDYPASLTDNFQPGGTSQSSIRSMTSLLTDIATRCPNAKIAAGGYSQGAALTARTIEKLSSNIKNRIGAVFLFGYTQNQQLRGGIPGFPQDRIKVICNPGDAVCTGTLTITAAHLQYGPKVPEAVNFVASKLR